MSESGLYLSNRLALAAHFARSCGDGFVFADIGTDHAYLPASLVLSGAATAAVASDVRQGPLDRAAATLERYGVADKITLTLADGLDGIEEYKPDVVAICGMGGDLMSEIISRSEYVRSPAVSLVLQPMSMADRLRAFLCGAGFCICAEGVAEDDGKLYQCMLARYDGTVRSMTPAALEVGEPSTPRTETEPGLFTALVRQKLRRVERKIAGRSVGGLDTREDEQLADGLRDIIKSTENKS
jgi:tRNA (adenine22-N1)-methyltransferase